MMNFSWRRSKNKCELPEASIEEGKDVFAWLPTRYGEEKITCFHSPTLTNPNSGNGCTVGASALPPQMQQAFEAMRYANTRLCMWSTLPTKDCDHVDFWRICSQCIQDLFPVLGIRLMNMYIQGIKVTCVYYAYQATFTYWRSGNEARVTVKHTCTSDKSQHITCIHYFEHNRIIYLFTGVKLSFWFNASNYQLPLHLIKEKAN